MATTNTGLINGKYSADQVYQAVKDSVAQGFTVEQARTGALNNFGVSNEDFDRSVLPRIKQAANESMAQNFTLDQTRTGALNNYKISNEYFDRAMAYEEPKAVVPPPPPPPPSAAPVSTYTATLAQAARPAEYRGYIAREMDALPEVKTTDVKVDEKQLVQDRLRGLIAEDSPLLQQARARAMQGMNARGLINSSMATGAADSALYDAALQIVTPDAQTYAQAARQNAGEANTNSRFNVDTEANRRRFNADSANQAAQFGAQAYNTAELTNTGRLHDLNITNAGFQNSAAQFNAGERNRFALQSNDQNFTRGENQAQRDFTRYESQADRDWRSSEATAGRTWEATQQQIGRDFQVTMSKLSFEQQKELTTFQNNLNKANIAPTAAANAASALQNRIDQIVADPNWNPAQKDSAITSATNAANDQIAFLSKLYNTPLPSIGGAPAATTAASTMTVTDPSGQRVPAPPYFQRYPDVAKEYEITGRPSGMSPEDYAIYHYRTYGRLEGREAP